MYVWVRLHSSPFHGPSSDILHQKFRLWGLSAILLITKALPTKGEHFKSSAKETVATGTDLTLQPSYYNKCQDRSAALLLVAFSRCFHSVHTSSQMENMGRLPRSSRPPTAAHHQWAAGDGCQVSALLSEVTIVLSKCRLLPHKKWNSPIWQLAFSYVRDMTVVSINC